MTQNCPQPPTLTLLIPVYEEKENILHFIEKVVELVTVPFKALIIYDREDDTTLVYQDRIESRYPHIRFVKNLYKPGVVTAFRTGFKLAETEYIVPIMADLSDDPAQINEMVALIQNDFDLVVCSRYMAGGAKIGGPPFKGFLSRVANKSLHALSGIPTHDFSNAFIMYRSEVVKSLRVESSGGFEITMEIIAKAFRRGLRITEIPTVNYDRAGGLSKFQTIRWMGKYLNWYLYILYYATLKRLGIRIQPQRH